MAIEDSCTKSLPAVVSWTLRVDRSKSLTPILFSSVDTFRVSDGGVTPSFLDARMKFPSWAMITISMLISSGFFGLMNTYLVGRKRVTRSSSTASPLRRGFPWKLRIETLQHGEKGD